MALEEKLLNEIKLPILSNTSQNFNSLTKNNKLTIGVLTVEEDWDSEEKAKELSIPGIALPGLRDLKIQFIALIEFDLFLGPIVHINEIQRGSSYIEKLKNYQTLSEVYAGVARQDIDTITTQSDQIAVFRYDIEQDDNETETTNVLLISCIPDSDMDDIREIGQKALYRSKGKPRELGRELSTSLREFQTKDLSFKSETVNDKVNVLEENRIKKSLDLKYIKGYAIYDLDSKLADFRSLPEWASGKELTATKLLRFLDNQLNSIDIGSVTSLLFQGLPLVATQASNKDIYILIMLESTDISIIQKIGEWLTILGEIIAKEWKFSSVEELFHMFEVMDQGISTPTSEEYIRKYLQMIVRSKRIFPTVMNKEVLSINPPGYLTNKQWKLINNLNGELSLLTISKKYDVKIYDLIKLLEWSKSRNIVGMLQD